MGKYCVIHISETRGAIDTKFAGYIHPGAGGLNFYIFTLRSMGKYCVIHISATRGAIDTKFAGYIHPVLPEVLSAFGVARSRRVPAAGG